jgi:DNA-binding NtrC family response regulator
VSENGKGPAGFRVLVVDDEILYAKALARELQRHGTDCDVAHSGAEALAKASSGTYDAVLLDHKLPDDDGIRLVPVLRGRLPGAAVLVMTAFEAIPNAIQAIRLGAEDYLVKQPQVGPVVEAVLEVRRRAALRQVTGEGKGAGGLLGRSPAIEAVRDQLRRVGAQPETTVLLTGETGVGKEVAARWLHEFSVPGGSPFVPVDCVALPGTLVESLLFGHERGAFTGAERSTPGAFEAAGDGTLFLDEVGEMDLALQGKLLRVLESREFNRVGSVRRQSVRARVVAATHRDLLELVKGGAFRFDLYQRLSVFPVHLPPLRERSEDVLLLARHFVETTCRRMGRGAEPLPREVEDRLLEYDFPGNVRELKHLVERALILGDRGQVEMAHLPERLLQGGDRPPAEAPSSGPWTGGGPEPLEALERRAIQDALARAGGVKTEAARLLGISRFRLLRRMARMGLRDAGGEDPT